MKKKESNQKIGCEVESCKHCNCDKHECLLQEIKVANDCNCVDCKQDTLCDSYDKRED